MDKRHKDQLELGSDAAEQGLKVPGVKETNQSCQERECNQEKSLHVSN